MRGYPGYAALLHRPKPVLCLTPAATYDFQTLKMGFHILIVLQLSMSNAYLGKVGTVSPLSYLPISYLPLSHTRLSGRLYACGCYAPYLRDELIVTVCTTSTTQSPSASGSTVFNRASRHATTS